MDKNKETNNYLIVKIELLILVVGLIVEICWFVSSNPSIKNAIALATTIKPETFTELYFENHTTLPKIIKSREMYKFTFTVHNLENKDMAYPYVVYIRNGDIKTVLGQGTLYLKNNELQSVVETMEMINVSRKEVVVELTDKQQIISFWVDKI